MDPNATWELLLSELEQSHTDRDNQGALDYSEALLDWTMKGGFLPEVLKNAGFTAQSLVAFLSPLVDVLHCAVDLGQ